ncbi:MAG TPA: oligosaccharide flippase family protein [Methylocella sp.]|jgi:O-antigen/teichoic acid export membrane protein
MRKNSLLSGSATYLVSNILNAAVPLALLPILTRYLTREQYGEVAMFQALLAVLGAVTGLSATGAAGRKYYDADLSQEELKFFIGSCFQILLVSGILVFVVLAAFQGSLSQWIGLHSRWILPAFATAAASFAIQIRMGQWQVSKNALSYALLQVMQSVTNALLSLILVVFFLQAESGRIWAQVVTSLVFACIALLSLHKDKLLGFAWRPRHLEEALKFGLPLIPHTLGVLVLSLFDRFMINTELGLAEVGIYMVAVQLASAMGLLFDAINKAFVPWLFEHLKRDQLDEKQKIVRLTYCYFLIALLVAGMAFLVGPFAVRLIAGDRYAAAGEAIGWLALGQAFVGMYLMVTNYIFYSKKTGLLALVTASSGLLNMVALLLLINHFGLVGAAMASALAMAARFLLTWWVAQKSHPMPWLSLNALA